MRAGFHRDRNIDGAVVLRRHSLAQAHADVIEQLDPLAIDEEFQLLVRDILAETEVLHRKLVLAVGREMWRTSIPPRVPKGSPSMCWFCEYRRARCRPPPSATSSSRRPCARSRRGGRIGLKQCRRNRQRSRDIVEASRRIVRRQKRRGIDLEVEQDRESRSRIRFDSGDAARPSRDSDGRRLAIDLRFEPIAQPFVLGQRRPWHPAGGITPARSLRTTFSQSSG